MLELLQGLVILVVYGYLIYYICRPSAAVAAAQNVYDAARKRYAVLPNAKPYLSKSDRLWAEIKKRALTDGALIVNSGQLEVLRGYTYRPVPVCYLDSILVLGQRFKYSAKHDYYTNGKLGIRMEIVARQWNHGLDEEARKRDEYFMFYRQHWTYYLHPGIEIEDREFFAHLHGLTTIK